MEIVLGEKHLTLLLIGLAILCIAFAVLGIVQLLKGQLKQASKQVWGAVAFTLYFGFAALFVWLPTVVVTFLAIGVLAMALGQLGYEVVWQMIIGALRRALGLPDPGVKEGS
jgi:hypothetical protein